MRRLGITIVVAALCVAAVATVAQATGTYGLRTPVAVTPSHGTPTTTFTVRFKTPFATGSSNGMRSWEIASVANHSHSSPSCANATTRRLPPALDQGRVSGALRVAAKHWCTGTYAGTITLYRSIICNPGPMSQRAACPEIAFPPELVGRFRFTVAPQAHS